MGTISATIVGRLARDPELKSTKSGMSVCTLTVPIDTGWGDNKTTTWWQVKLFGKRAEMAGEHLRKGSWVCCTGTPLLDQWTDKDGNLRMTAKMDAQGWDFVGPQGGFSSGVDEPVADAGADDLPF